MRVLRNLKMLTIASSAFAVLVMNSTAQASECEFTFTVGDAQPCISQYNECLFLDRYTPAECYEALHGCAYGLCLTMHNNCTEECESQTGLPGDDS